MLNRVNWRGIKEVARSIIAHEPRLLIKRQQGLDEFNTFAKNSVRTWREKSAVTSVVRFQDVYSGDENQRLDMTLCAFPACRVMWIENSHTNSVLTAAAPMVQAVVHRPPLFHIHDHSMRSTIEIWQQELLPPAFVHCTWHLVREEDYDRHKLQNHARANWIVPMSLHDFKEMRDAFGDPSPFCNADAQIFPKK